MQGIPTIVPVTLFGALGCAARYEMAGWVNVRFGSAGPVGTFAVNLLGSFVIGLLTELSFRGHLPAHWRLPLTAGFLGGFTTFSAFSHETARMVEGGDIGRAALAASASVVLCLLATFAGIAIARRIVA